MPVNLDNVMLPDSSCYTSYLIDFIGQIGSATALGESDYIPLQVSLCLHAYKFESLIYLHGLTAFVHAGYPHRYPTLRCLQRGGRRDKRPRSVLLSAECTFPLADLSGLLNRATQRARETDSPLSPGLETEVSRHSDRDVSNDTLV